MKRKPWPIVLLALLHVFAPLGNLLMNSYRSGRNLEMTWNFWYYTLPRPLFFTYVLLPPLGGIFIYICHRWSYWCYVACLGFIFIGNIYGFWTSMNWINFATLFVILLLDALAVAYFVVPAVRRLYFDPRMRWWETAPRYNFDIQGTMDGHKSFIKNISVGGALIETEKLYSEGQGVEVKWSYGELSFSVPGKIVYQRKMNSLFGCGVRFDQTSSVEKAMNQLIARLHKEGKKMRNRPGPEDSFLAWLKKLILEREGLFPKTKS
ncbi:MAG: PilZ domain-containing protein [Pseudobdellovibrionaceae bacterium]